MHGLSHEGIEIIVGGLYLWTCVCGRQMAALELHVLVLARRIHCQVCPELRAKNDWARGVKFNKGA